MMKPFLDALPSVAASPFALIAYVLVLAVFAYITTAQARLKRIASIIGAIPEGERASLIAREYNVLPAKGLSAEAWIRSRRQILWFWAFAAVLVALIVIGTIALQKVS